jgi:serine/threonine-protein kinase
MLGGAFATGSARRRFEREVELAARLKHPDIVTVHDSGEAAGQRYCAMDYVSGIRLDQYLARSQPDTRTILSLFARICEAVDYAHGHGVVHRDLKPSNVLVDDEGHPHILDFGLAKATDQADTEETLTTCVSLPGQVMGTLFYLSPEQAAGMPDQIDGRTDVYGLGVMLFEALTGSLPYDVKGRPSEIIRRILETLPARPSALSDRVDGELETIVLKALEKEQARRYQSAKEMSEDLRRYLEGEPILARRPVGTSQGGRLRSHPVFEVPILEVQHERRGVYALTGSSQRVALQKENRDEKGKGDNPAFCGDAGDRPLRSVRG